MLKREQGSLFYTESYVCMYVLAYVCLINVQYYNLSTDIPYLSVLNRAHLHAWAQIHAGYCSRINEINAWVRLNAGCHMQLFNSINNNGVIR